MNPQQHSSSSHHHHHHNYDSNYGAAGGVLGLTNFSSSPSSSIYSHPSPAMNSNGQPSPSPFNSISNHHSQHQQHYENNSSSSYLNSGMNGTNSSNGLLNNQTSPPQQNQHQQHQLGNNFIYNIQNQPMMNNNSQQHHGGFTYHTNEMQGMSNNLYNHNDRSITTQNSSPPSSSLNQQHTPDSVPDNSSSPNQDLQVAANSSDYHPIACIQCRRQHKQCDKKLPGCQRCLSKGITCEYKTPRRMRYPNQLKQKQQQGSSTTEVEPTEQPKKKKKKTADSKDNHPLDPENMCTPPNTSLTCKIPQTLSKRNIIDIYYGMICDHFIIIEKPVLEKYILNGKNSGEDVADESELPLKKEMQAFFFAATALVEQRMGLGDLSEKSAKKARDSLSKLFDEVNSYVVACTYASLGAYEIGSGRAKLSNFYFHNAKFYFESMDDSEKGKMTERERTLQKFLTSVEIVNADNDLGITTLIQDMPKVFEFTTGHQLPQEIVKATQQEVSPSNCLDYLKIVEMIASYLNKYFRGMATKTRGEKEMEMYDKGSNLCQGLLMNGLRVGVLTKAGYGKDLIEESSLRITYASYSEFFPFLPVIVIPHVALAARIHLQIVKKIEKGTRQNYQKGLTHNNVTGPIDYFDILAKDYRSLIILSKRFKRVSVHYGSLLEEIKEILSKRSEYQQQQNNGSSPTNHSNVVASGSSSSSGSTPIPTTDDALLHPLSLDSSSLPPLSFLLGSMNDSATPPLAQSSSSSLSWTSLDGYSSSNTPTTTPTSSSLQHSIFNSIIQSPIKSPSQQELYFADPFFTHEDLQQIFSPHTYGDFEDGEFSFNVK